MPNPPEVSIDPASFWADPYPALEKMQRETPICFVPELNAVLFTKRDDIFTCEKNIAVFSSDQPGGLMTVLMGENMMRKDGDAHMNERKQIFPSVSTRTVRDVWKEKFTFHTLEVLKDISKQTEIELCRDFAMPVSAHALRHITGLTNLSPAQMDEVSQGMIDGVANYSGDPDIEARCHAATELIDRSISEMAAKLSEGSPPSILKVLSQTDQPEESVRANIKLAISGGQNEPRDAIAGAVWALLSHPDQLQKVLNGECTWLQVFEEYARWMSPIGMSPRRVAQEFEWDGIQLMPEQRVFLMFGAANRDPDIFDDPHSFVVGRDTAKAISFGAGPHFCAGAAASRSLISEVALPLLFEQFPNMQINGEVSVGGWAFRGPLSVPIRLS